jgi:nicotinate dehydrogenase subunit A
MKIALNVNGKTSTVEVDDPRCRFSMRTERPRADGLRFGCGLGQCGACTVLVDGQAARSCLSPVGSVVGVNEEQALQCGYCIDGMIMQVKALFDTNKQHGDPVSGRDVEGRGASSWDQIAMRA